MSVSARAKRVWYRPDRPVEISARPASSVGMVIARVKCNLGLALLWSGLGHMSDLHPTRIVGRSALSIVTEQLAETPRGSFIRVEDGPTVYPREAFQMLALAAVAGVVVCWLLYALGVLPFGVDDVLRLDVVDRLRHHHETRTLRPS